MNEIQKLRQKTKGLFIYGAGYYARRVYKILQENKVAVRGFIVTNDTQCNRRLFDLPVWTIDEVNMIDMGIIVSASRINSLQIKKELQDKRCDSGNVIYACEYLDARKIVESYYAVPTIDVTTVIGCKVNCRFCPQELLLKAYFQGDRQRESVMTPDTFRACMENLPPKCNIMFCGMSEPFLNPCCSDMISMAYEAGKKVELYTTLVGLSKEDLVKIWDIPMAFVNVHVADEKGYAHIPATKEYFEVFEMAINHKRQDGSWFVNMCNAQGEPHPYIKELCKGRINEVSTVLHDRAGNLEGADLLSKRNLHGELSCSICGQDLNHNILLPDGTLLLCCMDYGMRHCLGNLKSESYEKIYGGDRLNSIKEGFRGNEMIDILCRNCSFASEVTGWSTQGCR